MVILFWSSLLAHNQVVILMQLIIGIFEEHTTRYYISFFYLYCMATVSKLVLCQYL